MLVRELSRCAEFTGGDNTILREILHPDKEPLKVRYSLAHARVKPGQASQPHSLKTSEVYYILQGEGTMYIGGESAQVREGDTVYIPPNAVQHIRNTSPGDLVFLCIVDPAWRAEDETVVLSSQS